MPDDFAVVSGRTDGEAWEPFDDCPVCQAQKAADEEGRNLSMEELQAAMKKAKEQGAVVGGPLLEEGEREEPRGGDPATWGR